MITDIHCHFVPDEFYRFVQDNDAFAVNETARSGDRVDLSIRGVPFGLNTTFFDMDRQVGRMRLDGVDRTFLSLATPFIDYHLDARLAVEAARIFNDGLARATSGRAEFGAWAFLPMQDPEAAAAELRRCVRDHGFVGGHVASNVRGAYLNAPAFDPIYAAATELDVPLFVHPADPLGKDRTRDHELTVVAGYLFDNTINILNLICSGFLDRWPRLKLVCAHTGAFSLALRARMQREVDTNPALSSVLKRPVGDYLAQLYFDSVCFEPEMLRYAASVVPVSHILLGSDAPFPLGEAHPVEFVRGALGADDAEAVLQGNVEQLFRR